MYYNSQKWPEYSIDKEKNKEHNLNMKDEKRSDIEITSVQNGYVVSVDKTVYVFPDLPSAMDFLETNMATPKDAKKFLDAQKPKRKQKDDMIFGTPEQIHHMYPKIELPTVYPYTPQWTQTPDPQITYTTCDTKPTQSHTGFMGKFFGGALNRRKV